MPTATKLRPLVHLLAGVALITAGIAAPSEMAANNSGTCSLKPRGPWTVVTFGRQLFANRGAGQAAGQPVNLTLLPGTYRVTLVSHDTHSQKANPAQAHEQWHLLLKDTTGATVAATPPISDLPDGQDTLTEIVTSRLTIAQPVTSATAAHSFFPASTPESITAVCAAFERLSAATPSASPSATPSPSASPSPALSTPTPEPTPEEDDDDEDEPDFALTIKKTDHRSTTRPGHSLTYAMTVRNSGSGTVEDIVVTDTLPSAVTATQVSDSASLNGHTVTWPEFALSPDEEKTVLVTVIVKPGTASGHTLTNNVKARSKDKGISVNDIDTTVVEAASQSGGQARTPRVAAAATAAPTPAPAAAVPVTAKTGSATPPLAALATFSGSLGLAYTLYRSRKDTLAK